MRPIFLVIDPPDVEMISTRKLILESAKYNVLTAFTFAEAMEVVQKIPVDAIVIHERVHDGATAQVARKLKNTRPESPLWVISAHPQPIDGADKVLSSFDPIALVELARSTFGDYVTADEGFPGKNPPSSKR